MTYDTKQNSKTPKLSQNKTQKNKRNKIYYPRTQQKQRQTQNTRKQGKSYKTQ